jgi:magnesium chelatase family protein
MAATFNGQGRTNAEADGELLDSVATPDEPGRRLLADAAAAMRLSARGFHGVLRVARTIAFTSRRLSVTGVSRHAID